MLGGGTPGEGLLFELNNRREPSKTQKTFFKDPRGPLRYQALS